MNYSFTSRHAAWISPVFFALAFYTLGACLMDSFVVYHTWLYVGEADFISMHVEAGNRIISVYVLPTLVMTIFLILQLWHRPRPVSRGLVWTAFAFTLIPWLSSVLIQIPIQLELDAHGLNRELLDKLILTDKIRVASTIIFSVTVFTMLRKSLAAARTQ